LRKEADEEENTQGTRTVGRFINAIHFQDGLFSNIYKTTIPVSNPDSFKGPPNSVVALKVTYPISMEPPHDSSREIRLLSKAVSPHVIPLWESFRDGGALVLVFPFMPYSLDMILRKGYLAEAHGRTYLLHIFRALAHLHALKIIHRDIKPANILMKSLSGPAYLADFGIAWFGDDPASEPATKKITDVGTTSYRAPELLFGKSDYDETLDLWAVGCVAAQVVTSKADPLFNSGDVGSDLTLIQSIFKALGTPTTEVCTMTLL
jgi:serine/threonine protein kinase